ncbi:MAG: hypothetical protein AAFU57_06745 [Bacteroidota bacterium]
MKKFTTLTLMVLVLFSCKTIDLNKRVATGKFSLQDQVYNEVLDINEDGSFTLMVRQPMSKRTCKGIWSVKSSQELLLNGRDIKKLVAGDSLFYTKLDCKDLTVKFISSRKIEKDGYHLVKVK